MLPVIREQLEQSSAYGPPNGLTFRWRIRLDVSVVTHQCDKSYFCVDNTKTPTYYPPQKAWERTELVEELMARSALFLAFHPGVMIVRRTYSLLFLLASSTLLFSQGGPPQSDPQAVTLAQQAIAALTNGNAVSDVTLTGNVTWSGGSSPETGTVTLLALGTGESRMNLSLPSGTRSEIRDASTGVPQGEWIAQDGSSGLFAYQNCATDAVWFFSALSSLSAGTNVVLLYIGQETWNGAAVQHVQSYIYQPPSGNPQTGPTYQQLSTMDFYLDASSFLPVAIVFNAHPDNDASTNLLIEADLSNYQDFNGFLVPAHIQRFLQGNPLVDMTISGASFNTGLPLSEFAIN